jgi:two-component system, OmpR family, sensor kinase
MSDPARLPVPDRDDEVARLGATLNEMLDRLQESFERERRLLNDAAHELRTPLAIMRAEVDLAQEKARTAEELHAALASVSEETDHVVALAEDLFVLARINGEIPATTPVETSLSELLQRAVDHHVPRAKALGVRLEVCAPETTVRLDPMRLRQALDNLADNALRHTPRAGLVRVSADQASQEVRINVEDSGPGFPDAFIDQAFVPFTRASSGHEDHDGAGLGLAIVRAIAESHGGSAIAENRPKGGARVTMVMPTIDRAGRALNTDP